jgi:hypothetical protein
VTVGVLFAAGQATKGEAVSSEKEALARQPTEVLKEMLRMYRDFMKTAKWATPREAHSIELIELILSERPAERPNRKGS